KSFDEHAAFVVGRGIHWTANNLSSPLDQPVARACQERTSDFGILRAFVETKEAGFFVVELVMRLVEDGGDSTDHSFVAARQKEFHVRISVNRMLTAVEQFLNGDSQWRNPVGVVAVKGVRQFDELFQPLFSLGRNHLNARQSPGPLSTGTCTTRERKRLRP